MPGEITPGVLVTCDVPIKAFIKKIDDDWRRSGAGRQSFILKDLDETHLLVRPPTEEFNAVEYIQEKLAKLQENNAYARPVS